jgi:hypothetical protein
MLAHPSSAAAMRMTHTCLPGLPSPLCFGLHVGTTSFPYQVKQVTLAPSLDGAWISLTLYSYTTAHISLEGRGEVSHLSEPEDVKTALRTTTDAHRYISIIGVYLCASVLPVLSTVRE